MHGTPKILHCDWLSGNDLIVDFSDGTTARFTVDQLSNLAIGRVLTDSDDLQFTNSKE